MLNDSQLNRLSEFTANLGLVFFATAITPLFSGIDARSLYVLLLGLILGAGCVFVSLLLLRSR